ncbi:MAG: sensor histidine kinase, partial [Anaerovoracaceae bacterium]
MYLVLVFYFCGLSASLVGILMGSGLLMAALSIVVGWRRADRRLRRLQSRLDALPEKYLIGETMELPADPLEREYYRMMKEISRSAIGAVEQARAEKQDYCDYVDRWVHEIKTPLTACTLILANGGEPAKLRRELRRADNLTETILTYAKLGTAEKDIQISRTNLRTACDQAVREEMELLIGAGISISIEGDAAVYTDGKLLVFILKQLLINCAKYCPGCQVRITLDGDNLTFE